MFGHKSLDWILVKWIWLHDQVILQTQLPRNVKVLAPISKNTHEWLKQCPLTYMYLNTVLLCTQMLCWVMIQLSGSVLLRRFSLFFSCYLLDRLLWLVCRSLFLSPSVTFAARLQPSLADGNLGCCLPGPGCRANPLGCLLSDQHADQTALQTKCPFDPELSDDCLAGRLE